MMEPRRLPAAVALSGLLLLAACATNPATGESQLTFMSQQDEIALGRQEHANVLAQFGGAYDDPALAAFVEGIGERLKGHSELAELDFTFTILDSPVVNAFALPGGFVYVSRGLLAYANDEAELAGVLGHEIGHVTGRHTAERMAQSQIAGGLVTVGSVLAGVFLGQMAGDLTQQAGSFGAQAYLASYSRDQEFQADELGVRYASETGYDPRGMSGFLHTLDRQTELDQKRAGQANDVSGFGAWFSTHPRTPERVARAAAEAAARSGGGEVDRDAYLAAIDGLIWGDDPEQGLIRGREFVHPGLRFAFTAPAGMRLINTPEAVVAQSQSATMVFDLARVPAGRDLAGYIAQDWAEELGAQRIAEVQPTAVRGMPAARGRASGRLQNGQAVSLALYAIRADDGNVYRFMFITQGAMAQAQAGAYEATVNSFRRLSEAEAAAIRPTRIRIATVQPGETVNDLVARMAVDEFAREQFEVINGLEPGASPSPGQKVKLIVEG